MAASAKIGSPGKARGMRNRRPGGAGRAPRPAARASSGPPPGALLNGAAGAVALAALLQAAAALCGPAGQAPAPAAAAVPRARVPPKIDGLLADGCWTGAPARVGAAFAHGVAGLPVQSPPLTAAFAWDEDCLYIGYEVAAPAGHGAGGDCGFAEFFIRAAGAGFFWEVHHDALNALTPIRATPAPPSLGLLAERPGDVPLTDGGRVRLDRGAPMGAAAGGPPPACASAARPGGGYAGEVAIPWAAVAARPGGKAAAGDAFRLLIVHAAPAGGPRYRHSSPTLSGGWFHAGERHWPEYVLTDGP